jgi:hypothetical protein
MKRLAMNRLAKERLAGKAASKKGQPVADLVR